jgi:hypothetical protein
MQTSNQTNAYNPEKMLAIIREAQCIIRNGRYEWVKNPETGVEDQVTTVPCRLWHRNLQAAYKMHFVVLKAIDLARPDNWQQLLLEWPHISTGNSERLAYTRDERAGQSDKQTVTSVAKYLRSHFSALPDHAVRDLAALASTQGCFMVDTAEAMVKYTQNGPYSCMQWDGANPEDHPYNVYDPGYGWKMAVRTEDGVTMGRCLVIDSPERKYFVRSYLRDEGRYSHSDPVLEAWLTDAGFHKRGGWRGEKMAHITTGRGDGEFLAPYIDGNAQNVDTSYRDGREYLVITDSGEYECTNTDGRADRTDGTECEDCGERISEDEQYSVGRNEDTIVCECCRDSYYRGVIGRRGNEYDLYVDGCVYVESQEAWYDENYLSDNDIVMAEDTEQYEHMDDCWTCAHSGNVYTNDCSEWVEYEGDRYHTDHIPDAVQEALDALDADDTEETN